MSSTIKKKKKGLFLALLIILVCGTATYLLLKKTTVYQYSAKYMCGTVDGPATQALLAPGEYRTDVNIHNPSFHAVHLWKKVVSSVPREPETGKPTELVKLTLGGDEAFEVDCPDIASLHGSQKKFDKGFVVLMSKHPLDVIDVLTVKQEHVSVIKRQGVTGGPPRPPVPPGEGSEVFQVATFIVRGEPVEGLPYRLDTKLTAAIPWDEGLVFDNTERIRQYLKEELLVPELGRERAEEIAAGQRIDYKHNDTVIKTGSVTLDFELIPGRRLKVKSLPWPH